jgi:hypothetical protein
VEGTNNIGQLAKSSSGSAKAKRLPSVPGSSGTRKDRARV